MNFRVVKGLSAAVFLLAMSRGEAALANEDIQCFWLSNPGTPEATSNAQPAAPDSWCYLSGTVAGENYRLIFKAVDNEVRPETSALVKLDSRGKVREITHGSLLKGKTNLVRSRMTAVNPLPVPLTIEAAAKRGLENRTDLSSSTYFAAKAMLQEFADADLRPATFRLEVGTDEAYLETEKMPYSGYWWPYQTLDMGAGPNSPLGKYDSFVQAATGTSPNSVQWERERHSLDNVEWGGHCNGWAASSLLYPDVTRSLWDEKSKQIIFSSDIKGMLAEASFCVDFAFYGMRYNGKEGEDMKDIYPAKFHQVLVYYLKNVKKPIAFDRFPEVTVDNHVITGFTSTVTQGATENQFNVVTKLRAHGYEIRRNEKTGPEKTYTVTLQYTLTTDGSGNVTGGEWLGFNNPDFLWVPLAQKKCGSENPRVDPAQIQKMLETLPEAKLKTVSVGYKLNRKLKAYEKLALPVSATKGGLYRFTFGPSDLGNDVMVTFHGSLAYPVKSMEGVTTYQQYATSLSNRVFEITAKDLSAIVIENYSNAPTPGSQFGLVKMEYLAGN